MNLLQIVTRRKEELEKELAQVNQVIELLSGDANPIVKNIRKHNSATKRKMREAWKARRAKKSESQEVTNEGEVSSSGSID